MSLLRTLGPQTGGESENIADMPPPLSSAYPPSIRESLIFTDTFEYFRNKKAKFPPLAPTLFNKVRLEILT